MTVEEQVISIFCGVKGFLDDIELKDIAEFESKILEKCRNENSDILVSIKSTGNLDDQNEKKLSELIKNLKSNMGK